MGQRETVGSSEKVKHGNGKEVCRMKEVERSKKEAKKKERK